MRELQRGEAAQGPRAGHGQAAFNADDAPAVKFNQPCQIALPEHGSPAQGSEALGNGLLLLRSGVNLHAPILLISRRRGVM